MLLRRRQQVFSKRRHASARLYRVTSQITAILIAPPGTQNLTRVHLESVCPSACYSLTIADIIMKYGIGEVHSRRSESRDSSVGVATGCAWTVRGLNHGGGEIFRTCPDRSWGPPSLLYSGYWVFPGGKAAGSWR